MIEGWNYKQMLRWVAISPSQPSILRHTHKGLFPGSGSGVVGGIMISYLTHLDMEYWGMECCGMSGVTTSHNWAGFYVKNDITFIFISTLEEEIRKMPDICLHLITPSLFHTTR